MRRVMQTLIVSPEAHEDQLNLMIVFQESQASIVLKAVQSFAQSKKLAEKLCIPVGIQLSVKTLKMKTTFIDERQEAQYFSFGACRVWSEILFLDNKDIIETFRKIVVNPDSKNKFIFEAINEILKIKHTIKCIDNNYPVKKISNIKTYHAIKEKL
jgi:hypothetical protein